MTWNRSLGPPPPKRPHDDVKLQIRAVTTALEHGEPSETIQAYTEELKALVGGNTGNTIKRSESNAGKRVS